MEGFGLWFLVFGSRVTLCVVFFKINQTNLLRVVFGKLNFRVFSTSTPNFKLSFLSVLPIAGVNPCDQDIL